MPPKAEVKFTLPESGIECKVQGNGLVTVGIGPGGPRHTVFKRKAESHEGLCTPEGALEMLREERREWQTALDSAVKVATGATFLARWLAQSGGAPAAE